MNLYNPQELKSFLGKHGIKSDKSLGQHFLCSQSVVETIVRCVEGSQGILEIGPGPGVLTSVLANRPSRLVAVELDPKMIELLGDSAPFASVLHEDALKTSLTGLLQSLEEPRSIVGNLPYYITGPLLTRIAEARSCFDNAIVMIQKEVADRIVAAPGNSNRGSLSVFLQSQFEIRMLCQASASDFLPPPKVDSTVLELLPRALPVPPEREAGFFKLIRLGFTQPRKTLQNNLLAAYHLDRVAVQSWLAAANLDPLIRPHVLTLGDWKDLDAVSPNR